MLHTVTETSRNEHAPSQPFLLGLTAGDENSVSAECAVCARLNAIEAVSELSRLKGGEAVPSDIRLYLISYHRINHYGKCNYQQYRWESG